MKEIVKYICFSGLCIVCLSLATTIITGLWDRMYASKVAATVFVVSTAIMICVFIVAMVQYG
jgi:hypothetical protein